MAGLPSKENSRLHNIHMVCYSNKCEVMDMARLVVDDLLDLELHGITAYDSYLGEEVLVIAPLMCVLCDNPQHAEIMNHSGPSANLFCRICMVSDLVTMVSFNFCQKYSKHTGSTILSTTFSYIGRH